MRKAKSLRQFIKENRKGLDNYIGKKSNDRERQLWILNDEGLYNWAKSEGVRI